MSLASALVIYPADYSVGQYPKDLEQSEEEKMIKIAKAIKTIVKARKLKNTAKIAYFLTFLLSLYYHLCLSKNPHLDDKNLQQNLHFLFFPFSKPKY